MKLRLLILAVLLGQLAMPIVTAQTTSNFTFKVVNSSGTVFQAWSVNWNALKTGW